MWEAIGSVLSGQNGVLLLLIAVVAVCALVLSGKLKVDTGKLKLGAADAEREVLRKQVEWLHPYCVAREAELAVFAANHGLRVLEQNGYFARYICEVMYDKCLEWLLWNHVSLNEDYVHLKKNEIFNLLVTLKPHPCFLTDEFRKTLDGWTEHVLRELIRIRKIYRG